MQKFSNGKKYKLFQNQNKYMKVMKRTLSLGLAVFLVGSIYPEKPEIDSGTREMILKKLQGNALRIHEKYNPYPIFGPGSEINYQIDVIGSDKIQGKDCYVIRVTPKRKTDRHVVGRLFVDTKTYSIIQVKASLAKLPFGAKSLDIDMQMENLEDHSVAKKGIIRYLAHVPFVINDRVENEFLSLQDRYIER